MVRYKILYVKFRSQLVKIFSKASHTKHYIYYIVFAHLHKKQISFNCFWQQNHLPYIPFHYSEYVFSTISVVLFPRCKEYILLTFYFNSTLLVLYYHYHWHFYITYLQFFFRHLVRIKIYTEKYLKIPFCIYLNKNKITERRELAKITINAFIKNYFEYTLIALIYLDILITQRENSSTVEIIIIRKKK